MDFFNKANILFPILQRHRRYLHQHAEAGFAIDSTKQYVAHALQSMHISAVPCGKAGLCAEIGNSEPTVLLRADMDALPFSEETKEPFRSETGNMHACGHDLHTAMLLGAAQLLKENESTLKGTVRFMFQPAEELLEGAKDMMASGILENPPPVAALMLHVSTAVPFETGTVLVSAPTTVAPAADYFSIQIQGKGCHGSTPAQGIDPFPPAAHILQALPCITARELPLSEKAVLTFGQICGGNAPNAIPNQILLKGSLRTYQDATRAFVKTRIQETVTATAAAFRTTAAVTFDCGCPIFKNDARLSACAMRCLKGKVHMRSTEGMPQGGGSEDFAYVSQKIPTLLINLPAGCTREGYTYPLHHPRVQFDEAALPIGTAVYATFAEQVLAEYTQNA